MIMTPGDGYEDSTPLMVMALFVLGHNWSVAWNFPSERFCRFGICVFLASFAWLLSTF